MMLLPGPLGWLLYSSFSDNLPELALALASSRGDIAAMVAGFSFTMLGFLATVITLLFAFSHSATFRRYRNRGHLEIFFFGYYLTIFSLVITSFLALANFSSTLYVWMFRGMLVMFSNNLLQVLLLTFIICKLAFKAGHETDT